jgi:hypothetical protein
VISAFAGTPTSHSDAIVNAKPLIRQVTNLT